MTRDVMALANVLREAAKAEILPRFRRLAPQDVQIKTEAIDLVTEADQAAERAIFAAISALAPDSMLVGEESVAADPSLMDGLSTAAFAVVVDPIDGTANYAAGLPLFAVMAAVVQHGVVTAGIIYDPMGDDWVIAEKGRGALLHRPDGSRETLSVAAPVALEAMVGHTSLNHLPEGAEQAIFSRLHKPRVIANYRTAAHDYRTFASGHCHFLMFNKLMPWDHLAGSLIVTEAGGYVAKFDGSAYGPADRAGGLLVAPDRATWEMLRAEVFTF